LTALRKAARIGIADIDAWRFKASTPPTLSGVISRSSPAGRLPGGRIPLGDGPASVAQDLPRHVHPIAGQEG
jgi:hypothetical protein